MTQQNKSIEDVVEEFIEKDLIPELNLWCDNERTVQDVSYNVRRDLNAIIKQSKEDCETQRNMLVCSICRKGIQKDIKTEKNVRTASQ